MAIQLMPRLAIMDVEHLESCRAMHVNGAPVPVIAVLKEDAPEEVRLAWEVGANDFIIRPIHRAGLLARIRMLLRNTDTAAQLEYEHREMAVAQQIVGIGHWAWRVGSQEVRVYDMARRVLNVPHDEVLTLDRLMEHVHEEDRRRVRIALECVAERDRPSHQEFRLAQNPGAEDVFISQHIQVFTGPKRELWVAGTVENISRRRRAQQRIIRLAYYDSHTGLPNRTFLREAIDAAIDHSSKRSHVALLSIDIDDFQRINDTFDHDTGDRLLAAFADRLSRLVRDEDNLVPEHTITLNSAYEQNANLAARSGGDEFAVLLTELYDLEQVERMAQRVCNALTEPFLQPGQHLVVTVSLGIAVFPEHGKDSDALLKNADAARHYAQYQGRGYAFYTDAMNSETRERLTLELAIRRALDNGAFEGFELHYQPKVSAATGKPVGMEALLRWTDRTLGFVSPARLIPVAEESGLILPIGAWVLRTAVRQNKAWLDRGISLRMSVNVSAHQFRQQGFVEFVEQVLKEEGLPAELLDLEITESILMTSAETSENVLAHLRALNVQISLDDFGTGYSSLSYLNRFPIDTLKIDRSFVIHMATDPDAASIVKAIISLSQSLNLHVIAEGVETEQQLAHLQALGCDEIQGYFFSRPLPVGSFETWVRDKLGT